METFISYILRSSLILTIVFLVYQWLRNDRRFIRNRIFLLAGLLLAIVLPWLSFIPTASVQAGRNVLLQPVIISSGNIDHVVDNYPDMFQLIWWVWFSGVMLLLVKMVFQLFRLYRLAKKARITRHADYTLLYHPSVGTPFSFFHLIFLNQSLNDTAMDAIIAHEKVHAGQRHSWDVLFMEMVCALQWFNPAVWYYRQQLREVHEYLADSNILHKGIEKAAYLQLLYAMAMKVQPAELTNSFCQIKLKRRLKMITKSQKSRFSGVKFILMLPVMGLFIWMVSCNQTTNNADSGSEDSTAVKKEQVPADNNAGTQTPAVNDNPENAVFTVVEDMPEYPGGNDAMSKFIASNIKYPEKAKENGVQGTVYVSFHIAEDGSVNNTLVMRGIGSGCDEEALRVVKLMPKWKPGKQGGKTVKVAFTLPVKFRLN